MSRLIFGLVVAAVVFTVYAIVDASLMSRNRIRGLPRGWWIVVILLVPVIGAVLWFLVGRASQNRATGPSLPPEDDPAFIGRLRRDSAQDERIRRLEQELADLDADAEEPDAPGTDPGHPHHHGEGDKPGRSDA